MQETPRSRRLRNDLAALERLAAESSVFQFKASGNPPVQYSISFSGKGLCRDRGKIKIVHSHHVDIKLGASYPRTIPEIRWLSPIYHPNISEIGMVCLGGYGTHWVPSVQLDELCIMLWDMVRYHNYDIRSPYNRDAALWVANQSSILFPTDFRALRDLRVAQGRKESNGSRNGKPGESLTETPSRPGRKKETQSGGADHSAVSRVRRFIERYRLAYETQAPTRPSFSPPPVESMQPRADGDSDLSFTLAPSASSLTEAPREPAEAEPSRPDAAIPSITPLPDPPPVSEEDEFVFLEDDDTPRAAPPPPVPASQDILFIE
jgi:ubiquitin-protein ligase